MSTELEQERLEHCSFREEIKLHMRETVASLKTLSIESAKSTVELGHIKESIQKIEQNDKLQWQRLDEHHAQIGKLGGRLTNTWFGIVIVTVLAGIKAYVGGK